MQPTRTPDTRHCSRTQQSACDLPCESPETACADQPPPMQASISTDADISRKMLALACLLREPLSLWSLSISLPLSCLLVLLEEKEHCKAWFFRVWGRPPVQAHLSVSLSRKTRVRIRAALSSLSNHSFVTSPDPRVIQCDTIDKRKRKEYCIRRGLGD